MLPMWAVVALLGVIPAYLYKSSSSSKDKKKKEDPALAQTIQVEGKQSYGSV
jgi:hypothetical protein